MGFEEGSASIDELIDYKKSQPSKFANNEAETRFHIIDKILNEVLGWPRNCIRVEQRTERGYTDYEIGQDGTSLIVEAKKEEMGFTLPSDTHYGVVSIAPLLRDKSNSNLKSAMTQVMNYCSERGVAPAIVTNGEQWVCFLASRVDSLAPLAGRALIFPSLESIRENFLTFWKTLSPEGISTREVFKILSVAQLAPPHPLSSQISNYPGVKQRNSIQSNLQVLGELVLEDFPTNPEYATLFLSECYATSGALSNYAEISKELLVNRYSLVSEVSGANAEPVNRKKGLNKNIAVEATTAALSSRPIVLLGSVGAGKSTFIQRLIHVDAKEIFDNALTILVNYGHEAVIEDIADFTVKEVERQLYSLHGIDINDHKFIEDLYKQELGRFDSGIYGGIKSSQPSVYSLKRIEFLESLISDRSEHMARAFDRIFRSHRKQVIIFLDNVDQRSMHDQSEVFLVSNELAAKWRVTVFVALRPETYFESERYGAASGYHPRIFTIAPPRTDSMLQKRVEFGLKILESPGRGPAGSIGLSSENLEHFLRMLKENFTKNKSLIQMIENVAGGNMRRALDFVTQFIGSGHLDTEKIITIQRLKADGYTIPQHEFLRSLLHGDGIYYDPKESPLPNLFHITQPMKSEHFIIPLLLDFLDRKVDSRNRGGYVDIRSIYSYLQSLGFKTESIAAALQYGSRHRLLDGPSGGDTGALSDSCRPTTVGIYALNRLPSMFAYVDPIIVDTPVLEQEFSERIVDVFSLQDRLDRTESFRKYLDNCWESSDFGTAGWSWRLVSENLASDIALVRKRSLNAQKS